MRTHLAHVNRQNRRICCDQLLTCQRAFCRSAIRDVPPHMRVKLLDMISAK